MGEAEVIEPETNGGSKVRIVIAPEPIPSGVVDLQMPREWGDLPDSLDGSVWVLKKKSAQSWAIEAQ